MKTAQARMGHANPQLMLRVYAQGTERADRAAAEKVGAFSGILEMLHRELSDPNNVPVPSLRRMVAAGWLGRKSGRGFYQYR